MDQEGLGGSKKKAKRERRWVVFLDESGVSQKPSVRRTWAPRGRTPVLRHRFNWKKLSICTAIAYRWDGRRSRLVFQIVGGSYTDEKLIGFLGQLRKELRGRRAIVIWDGLPSHRSRRMSAYLDGQRRHLSVVRLPAYAPELNPVESVWSNIHGQELANLCTDDLARTVDGVRRGFRRIHQEKQLYQSFLTHAKLSFA